MPDLARLLDPAALDAVEGPHGKMVVDLSSGQLGQAVEVVVPRRLVCARCEGGGCDACGRSGAIRVHLAEAERTTHFILPMEANERLLVRLVRPLGDDAGLEQLTIEVRLTPATSSSPALSPVLIAAALTVAAVLAIAAGMR